MGLLDNLLKGTGDPQKDAALSQGLLQAGLSLLSSRGNFGSALGQAGMQGLQGFQQSQDRSFQQSQRAMQIEQMNRQKAMQALPGQFMKPGVRPPTMDDRDVGQPGEAPVPPKQFDFTGYADALAQYDPVASVQMQAALRKDDTPIKVGQGDTLLDPRTRRPIYTSPAKPEAEPSAVREYLFAKTQGYPGSFNEWELSRRRAGASNVQVGLQSPIPVDIGGGQVGYVQPANRPGAAPQQMVNPATGKPYTKPADKKDLTEGQAKATALLGQMKAASGELSTVGFDAAALSNQAQIALAGGRANIAVSQKAQRVKQAQDQWSEAFLRFKTGAASTEDEVIRNNRTFFPVQGDKPDVIAQKKRMRAQAESDMEIAAGRGAEKLDQPAQPTANDPLGLR